MHEIRDHNESDAFGVYTQNKRLVLKKAGVGVQWAQTRSKRNFWLNMNLIEVTVYLALAKNQLEKTTENIFIILFQIPEFTKKDATSNNQLVY